MSACLLGTRSTGLSMPISDMDAHSLEQYINPPKEINIIIYVITPSRRGHASGKLPHAHI